MQADGTEIRPLHDPLSIVSDRLDWSPDGAQLAISSFVDGRGQIFTVEVASGEAFQVTDTPYTFNANPSWSADGTQIAFMASAGGGTITADLLVVNADGSGLRFVASDAKFPAWRP
jgi:Tol biopolymer transport system component